MQTYPHPKPLSRPPFVSRLAYWLPPVVILALAVGMVQSFPRLSAEQAVACKQCHISPSGGGARNEFGNYATAFQELCLPATKKLVEKQYKPPRIGDVAVVGLDTRWLVLDGPRVFRMQTDFFATLDLFKGLKYHFRFSETGIAENYALFTFAKEHFEVKAGTFYPVFGLHIDDHTAYIRSRTGFGPRTFLDGLSLYADVAGVQLFAESFAPNKQNVAIGHVMYTRTVGPVSGLIGGSIRLAERLPDSTYGPFEPVKSVFGSLAYDRLTLLGEGVLIGKGNEAVAGYVSSVVRLDYGLYLLADYNYYDHDRHLQTGTEQFWRYSLELYPLPFVQVRPSYTRYTARQPGAPADQWFVQFHVGY